MDIPKASQIGPDLNRNTADPQLRAGALNFSSVLMQAVTHIGPAVGIVFCVPFIALNAGITSPLAYAIAFAIVLTLGVSLAQLARVFPSAGGYYTYVSRSIHPSAGFLTGWLYFLYDPPAAAANLALMSLFLERALRSGVHIEIPWRISFTVLTVVIAVLIYRGIAVSIHAMVAFTLSEMAIVVGLAISCLLHPGNPGLNFSSFLPHNSPGAHGLFLGVVFCIFAFTGFESVAPLAEESVDPRRNLPRVIVWSIVVMGIFYLFSAWALLVGWGTNSMQTFAQSAENPVFVLATRLWGKAWILILIAVFNSILAFAIACTNASTRVFFAMARSGTLPHVLSKVHPRYQTPVNAIWLQTILTLGIGLGLGWWMGPDQLFYFLGVAMTLGMVIVYSAGNLGVFSFYRQKRRHEFGWWLHAVFPVISTIAMALVAYESVVPLPPAPVKYAPWLVAVWLLCGGALVCVLGRSRHGSRLLEVGDEVYGLPSEKETQNETINGAGR